MAYQAIKFKRGEIDGEEFFAVLQASFGEDVFKEAEAILDNKEKSKST
jgi:hypothetical protein